MLNKLVSALLVVCLGVGACFSQSFLDSLREGGFSVSTLQQQRTVSRYELTRYLNALQCVDCFFPSATLLDQYDQGRLDQAKSVYQISDISLDDTLYQGEDYYMCVALAVDTGIMDGYTPLLSPFCRGSFCGANNATYIDLINGLYDLIRGQAYAEFSLNWQQVSSWYKTNIADYPLERAGLIAQAEQTCGAEPCPLTSPAALDIYVSYCGVNPNDATCALINYELFTSMPTLLSQINILIDLDIVSRSFIANIDHLYDPLDGETLLSWTSLAYGFVGCQLDNDLDDDGIVNYRDGCLYTCNPDQSDTDGDGLSDSCDDDIDNDGITNQLGVVDPFGNIDIELLSQSADNCILVANPNQENISGGPLGDACDPRLPAHIANAQILVNNLTGEVGQEMIFGVISSGDIEEVKREFGDGGFIQGGEAVTHRYSQAGLYVVQATLVLSNGVSLITKTTLDIVASQGSYIGCQGFFEPVQASAPASIAFQHNYAGDIGQVTRQYNNDLLGNVAPGDELPFVFEQAGRYRIDMQCYDSAGDRVGLSQLVLGIGEGGTQPSIYLQPSALTISAGETLSIDTVSIGIDQQNIDRIIWDFGDGPSVESEQLSTTKRYDMAGRYVITQTIFFVDGTAPLQSAITISVIPIYRAVSIDMRADTLTTIAGEDVMLDLDIQELSLTEVDQITRLCDNTPMHLKVVDATSLTHVCNFDQGGPKHITARVFSNSSIRTNTIAVYVEPALSCLTNISQLRCDFDEDGIPDLCDSDIDNDGIPNQIGLIASESQDCSLPVGNPSVSVSDVCADSYDNCPFIPNSDQADSDQDAIGDICDPVPESPAVPSLPTGSGLVDADGDGVPNDQDACPEIPESNNGLFDGDGCPEPPSVLQDAGDNAGPGLDNDGDGGLGDSGKAGDQGGDDNPFVSVGECEQCPCPFADFASEIRKGDRVRALLLDEAGSIIYEFSETEFIDQDVTEFLE